MAKEPFEPGDPDETEHDNEVAEPRPGDVAGERVGELCDQDDENKVVEQLEETDRPIFFDPAMRPRRPAPPLCGVRSRVISRTTWWSSA